MIRDRAPFGPAFAVSPARSAAAARLICIPYSGGNTAVFRSWTLGVADVLAARLPGRERRMSEEPLRSIAAMADSMAEQAMPFARELPLALFGHSMGALVAFETARRLARSGADPLLLIVSASTAPSVSRSADPVYKRADEDLIAWVEEMSGPIPGELKEEPELLQMLLRPLRADLEAERTYVRAPGEPLPCPLLVLAGTEEEIEERALTAWQDETRGPTRIQHLPGGHMFLLTAGDMLLGLIESEIGQALRGRGR